MKKAFEPDKNKALKKHPKKMSTKEKSFASNVKRIENINSDMIRSAKKINRLVSTTSDEKAPAIKIGASTNAGNTILGKGVLLIEDGKNDEIDTPPANLEQYLLGASSSEGNTIYNKMGSKWQDDEELIQNKVVQFLIKGCSYLYISREMGLSIEQIKEIEDSTIDRYERALNFQGMIFSTQALVSLESVKMTLSHSLDNAIVIENTLMERVREPGEGEPIEAFAIVASRILKNISDLSRTFAYIVSTEAEIIGAKRQGGKNNYQRRSNRKKDVSRKHLQEKLEDIFAK